MSHPQQEEDVVPTGKLLLVMLGTLLLTVGCVIWVALVMRPLERASRGDVPALPAARLDLGGPDRTLFEEKTGFSSAKLARQRARLESYGTVDAARGIVHIPIARAMELVARGTP